MKTTKKARIYGRFSSKLQEKGDSIRRQVEGAKEYAAKNGIVIIGEPYFDAGVSGKNGANLEKEFGRLLNDARDGEILLVEHTDRIGRQNPFILSNLIYKTVQKGIEIHIFGENKILTKDNIDELGTQLTLFTSAATGNQENRRKIYRVKKSVELTIAECSKGIVNRGVLRFTPECFKWDDNKKIIFIDETIAETVRLIFREYTNGNGTTTIAKLLNNAGTPTFYGKQVWFGNNVKVILTNECYNGVLSINGNRFTVLTKIVSDDIWQKAQMLVSRNVGKSGNFTGRTNNLFDGISYCKHCGGRMKNAATNRKYNYYSYCCKNSTFGGCKDAKGVARKNTMISARQVEYGFFKIFFGKGAHSLLKKEDRNIQLKEQIEACKAKQGAADRAISNLYDMAEQGDKEAIKRIAKRQAEKETLQAELKVLQAQITEDGQFESQVTTIYKMVTMEDIWVNKKPVVSINQILTDDINRKKIVQILPALFSKIIFDCPNNRVEVFSKDGHSLGSFSPQDFKAEVNSIPSKKTEVVTSFEPPKRTFMPRKITGKVSEKGEVKQIVKAKLSVKEKVKNYIGRINKK